MYLSNWKLNLRGNMKIKAHTFLPQNRYKGKVIPVQVVEALRVARG
jgi:hypothetical protein